jgi:hypothetical protein
VTSGTLTYLLHLDPSIKSDGPSRTPEGPLTGLLVRLRMVRGRLCFMTRPSSARGRSPRAQAVAVTPSERDGPGHGTPDAPTAAENALGAADGGTPLADKIAEVPIEAPKVDESNSAQFQPAVGVAVMITKAMESQLEQLGYSSEEINRMKPDEAWAKLNNPSG